MLYGKGFPLFQIVAWIEVSWNELGCLIIDMVCFSIKGFVRKQAYCLMIQLQFFKFIMLIGAPGSVHGDRDENPTVGESGGGCSGLASESSDDEEEGGRSTIAPRMKANLLKRAARAKRAIAYE